MCIHRLYIYSTCGHSLLSPRPLLLCCDASIPPDGSYSTTCELKSHPFQSWKLESLCPECDKRRDVLLSQVEVNGVVYDKWRWKVSYGVDANGEDFWGKKAEERAKMEKETG